MKPRACPDPQDCDVCRVDVGTQVVAWYRAGHRDLPWRHSRDPYRILVSELMLQQTRVDTVLGYYDRFLEAFPDVRALADAPESGVMALWQGLGYYARARNLQKAAQAVVGDHGGVFPPDPAALLALPGVGPYTAGAIASIAFGLPVPAVDGNVLRVMARLCGLEMDVTLPATRKWVERLVARMIPQEAAGDFCQAMMELGAVVCIPSRPACAGCPLRGGCSAYWTDRTDTLPVRSAKAKPVESSQAVYLIRDNRKRLLVAYRKQGLLEGLWGLPHQEAEANEPELDFTHVDPDLGRFLSQGRLVLREKAGSCRHVFTHRVWNMQAWWVDFLTENISEDNADGYKWLEEKDLGGVAIPEAFRKVLRLAGLSLPAGRRKNGGGNGKPAVWDAGG